MGLLIGGGEAPPRTRARTRTSLSFGHVLRCRRTRYALRESRGSLNNTLILGGYDPSTPYQHAKKRKTLASRPIAGSSNAKVSRITKTRKQKSTRESPVVVEDDDNDGDVPEVVQLATVKVPPPLPTNGKSASRPNGKGKAGLPTNGHRNDTEFVVINELGDDDPPPARPLRSAKKGKSPAGSADPIAKGAHSRELERLREERDLVRLSNISVHVLQWCSTYTCSTRKRVNSYPKASSSSYRQEIRSQRKSSYPVKLTMTRQAEVNDYCPDVSSPYLHWLQRKRSLSRS